jgi:hypothetical protein
MRWVIGWQVECIIARDKLIRGAGGVTLAARLIPTCLQVRHNYTPHFDYLFNYLKKKVGAWGLASLMSSPIPPNNSCIPSKRGGHVMHDFQRFFWVLITDSADWFWDLFSLSLRTDLNHTLCLLNFSLVLTPRFMHTWYYFLWVVAGLVPLRRLFGQSWLQGSLCYFKNSSFLTAGIFAEYSSPHTTNLFGWPRNFELRQIEDDTVEIGL